MPNGIPALSAHLASVAAARYADYAARSDARVRDAAAFEEMRAYLLDQYAGVQATHSFLDDGDQIFDCIPAEQQPELRAAPSRVVQAPSDAPDAPERRVMRPWHQQGRHGGPQLDPAMADRYGNQVWCPAGTVPMRRINLEDLVRFETLRDYHRMGRGMPRPAMPPPDTSPDITQSHRYAHAAQNVDNLGTHSLLNVWQPSGFFSLSQHWCSGGTGVGTDLQTAEAGWLVFQSAAQGKPTLFTYWTSDNYHNTGAYNTLIKVPNPRFTPGMTLNVSLPGAQNQVWYEFAWYLFQGNWWLYVGGTKAANAIGYFPTSQYAGGQLSRNATSIDFGGETSIQNAPAGTAYAQMGSGSFPGLGFGQAAFQGDVYYYTLGNRSQFANLTPDQPSPNCYQITVNH